MTRTWSTLEEDSSARGCIVDPSSEVEPRERGEGPVRILSFRRVDEAAGGGRFFGGGMQPVSAEAAACELMSMRQSTAPSSESVDCTWCRAAAAAATVGDPGETDLPGASEAAAGEIEAGSCEQSAVAAERLSNELTRCVVGGVISSSASTSVRTNPRGADMLTCARAGWGHLSP